MSDILLATKLHIPPLRRDLVDRPHILQRLSAGLAQNCRLTLISAPAGYGKSTLVRQWVSQLDTPVAWLSLEKGDNAPGRFWSYFTSALRSIPGLRQAGVGELVSHINNRNYRGEWHIRPEKTRLQWVAWIWPIEPIHYVGCASPAALLFQNGTPDTVVYPADALPYQEAGSEPKTVRWYCSGHNLNGAALQDQAEWLSEMIGLTPFPVDAQVLAAYAGQYQASNAIVATIRVDGTHIFLQLPNEPAYEILAGENELFAGSEDRFYLGATYFEFTFHRNGRGEVDRVVVAAEGNSLEARKLPYR